jgi:dethiobiotin synthetase
MKPVAAGLDSLGQNEDVEQLIVASSITVPKRLISPYCFRSPIAPHLAAAEEGVSIELPNLASALEELRLLADLVLVEGVGGFCVPLGQNIDTADMASTFGLPVILVVGLRLGCLNHALITAEAIRSRGLALAGWIANCIDPAMARREDNIAALAERLDGPLLGILPNQPSRDTMAASLELILP